MELFSTTDNIDNILKIVTVAIVFYFVHKLFPKNSEKIPVEISDEEWAWLNKIKEGFGNETVLEIRQDLFEAFCNFLLLNSCNRSFDREILALRKTDPVGRVYTIEMKTNIFHETSQDSALDIAFTFSVENWQLFWPYYDTVNEAKNRK